MNITIRVILTILGINSPSKALRKIVMWFPARKRKSRNSFMSTSDLDLLTLFVIDLMLDVSKVSKNITLQLKEINRNKLDSVPWSSDLIVDIGLYSVQLRCYSFNEVLETK